MSNSNLKLHIQQDQLTWFLDLLLDEREIFQLSAFTGIVSDVDRLSALSRRELLVNLTNVFLSVTDTTQPTIGSADTQISKPEITDKEISVETLVSQFLAEKAQAAISRVGYMEISEIETFFKTSDVLIEGGEFAEIVWALLTDKRTAVVEHGYRLLNTTYQATEVASLNGRGDPQGLNQLEKVEPQHAHNLEIEQQQAEKRAREIEHLARQLADSKANYTSLEKKHNRLDQQRAFLLEENKGLKTKAEAQHGNEKRLKDLEQENRVLREQIAQYIKDTAELRQLAEERELLLVEKARMAEQQREAEQIKAAKETFTTDLKLVEEAVYKGHQGLEDFQTSLDNHSLTLWKTIIKPLEPL